MEGAPEGVPESHAYGRKKEESLCGDMRESRETKPEMKDGDVIKPPALSLLPLCSMEATQ